MRLGLTSQCRFRCHSGDVGLADIEALLAGMKGSSAEDFLQQTFQAVSANLPQTTPSLKNVQYAPLHTPAPLSLPPSPILRVHDGEAKGWPPFWKGVCQQFCVDFGLGWFASFIRPSSLPTEKWEEKSLSNYRSFVAYSRVFLGQISFRSLLHYWQRLHRRTELMNRSMTLCFRALAGFGPLSNRSA